MGFCRDNGKEIGNYDITVGYILGLYRDHGEENRNYNIRKTSFLRPKPQTLNYNP